MTFIEIVKDSATEKLCKKCKECIHRELKGEEDDAAWDKKNDKDEVDGSHLWPFCGISGARYSILEARVASSSLYVRVVTLVVDREAEDE